MEDFELVLKAVIETPRGILIVQRSESDKWLPGVWEFPGGKCETGESLKNTLKREVKEETGLIGVAFGNMKVIKKIVKQVGPGEYKYEAGQYIVKFYIYGTKKKNYEIKLSDEHQSFMWVKNMSQTQGLPFKEGVLEILQEVLDKK